MPKTKKRATARRAAKIAKAHATPLPKLEGKEYVRYKEKKVAPRRAPGYKKPARGIARYPVASVMLVLLIAFGVWALYVNHLGPFAPQPVKPKPVVVSPCLNTRVVNELTDLSPAPSNSQIKDITHQFKKAPDMGIDLKSHYCIGLNTSRGLIVMDLDPKLAPNTVNNFVFLAEQGFYNGLVFHRVVPKFVIQTGDPSKTKATGVNKDGPGYTFKDEPVKGEYKVGCIAMANAGANTNGSQFFICITDDTKLPKQYNLFGYVVKGLDIVQKIQGPNPDDPKAKNVIPDTINHVIVVPVP